MNSTTKLQVWLAKHDGIVLAIYAGWIAFCTYSCMYAFRKPLSAGTFENFDTLFGIQYKTTVVILQLIGYLISKFIGIKIIAELNPKNRFKYLLLFVSFAGLTWLGFSTIPHPYNLIFPFLNGLPLGMIWGIVFSYLEGRKFTELMGLSLSASFIFASAFVKDIAKMLMQNGVSELWMPFCTAIIFFLPLVFFGYLLEQIPSPSLADIQMKTKRIPMDVAARKNLFNQFAFGLITLISAYVLLSIYRDFRDNFMAEIFIDLQMKNQKFTDIEIGVSVIVLLLLSLMMLIKNNRTALQINFGVIGFGFLIIGLTTYANINGMLSNFWWMFATGLGAYLAYIPYNSILFDRLIATYKVAGNTGFLIYLADSFGYVGSLLVMFYKNFGQAKLSWAVFFGNMSLIFSVAGILLIGLATFYFWNKKEKHQESATIQIS